MWSRELRDSRKIYSQVTANQLLENLRTVCTGMHEIDEITILSSMMSMYEDVDSIPEYINVLKDARNRLARAAMTITDEQVMAISSPSVLASDDYHTECKQWNKLLTYQCTWFAWKTTFCDASAVRIRADGIRGESDQPFDGFSGVAAQQQTPSVGFDPLPVATLPRDAQMLNTMAGYMDNLANAVGIDSGSFTAVKERLAEITATLKSLSE